MNEIIEYWDKAVCEAWHGDAPVGSALWSEQVTRHRYYVQPHILEFAEFRRWEGKSVLEIGCGIGTDTKKFMNAGAKVWAVDSSEKSIEIADLRCPKAMFYCQDAEEWLPYGPFDLIWSFGVLHHTPHPEKVLKLAARRLKPDGELRIMLYAKWSLKHLLGTQPEALAGCPLVKWYSEREARRLVESCGFEVVSVKKRHIFPWKIREYREHRFVKAFPWNIVRETWFESLLGHHLLLVARRSPLPRTPASGTTPLSATGATL